MEPLDVLKKRSARAPFAVLTVTALVGSAIGIAPHFASPQMEATAATLSGGIRDNMGAIEEGDQKASDLPAGSCMVEATEYGGAEGSQSGFSWKTSEPGATSLDKTRWGLSVSFDNSKDRTFADWGFTNSGLMGRYLNTGQVPTMDAGESLNDAHGTPVWTTTDKADENLAIDGSRQQRNLNLNAELTEDKVKQFAEATADNPVVYGWKGSYTRDSHNETLKIRVGTAPSASVKL